MKKIFILLPFACLYLYSQNVGIGTLSPSALLHVADSSVLFSAPATLPVVSPPAPVNGIGSRLLWFAPRAALRLGTVNSDKWDAANIGTNSVAFGYDTKATGFGSTSWGNQTNAISDYATAWGYQSSSEAVYATAWGVSNRVLAYSGTAWGINSIANGNYATAFGGSCTAYGQFSAAFGVETFAQAYGSVAIGSYNPYLGYNPSPSVPAPSDRIFQIGNGDFNAGSPIYSNAMTVLRNGNIGIGNLTPSEKLVVTGNATVSGNATISGGASVGGSLNVASGVLTVAGNSVVRSIDGTMRKIVVTPVTVNVSIGAGSTVSIPFNFAQPFGGTPDVYVGNVIGGGGFAEVILSIATPNTFGASLFVNNPRTGTFAPNFTIKIIAIGAQ